MGEQSILPGPVWPGPHASCLLFVTDLLHQARTLTQTFFSRLSSRLILPLRIDKVYCLHTDITPRKPCAVPLKKKKFIYFYTYFTIPPYSVTLQCHLPPLLQVITTTTTTPFIDIFNDLVMRTLFLPRICQAPSMLARSFSHQFG